MEEYTLIDNNERETNLGILLKFKSLIDSCYIKLETKKDLEHDDFIRDLLEIQTLMYKIDNMDFGNENSILNCQKLAIYDLYLILMEKKENIKYKTVESPRFQQISINSKFETDKHVSTSLNLKDIFKDDFEEDFDEDFEDNIFIEDKSLSQNFLIEKNMNREIITNNEMLNQTNILLAENNEKLELMVNRIESISDDNEGGKTKGWLENIKENKVVIGTILLSSFVFSTGGVILSHWLTKEKKDEQA